ncbi:hypothetical protein ACSFFW_005547, partial [Klebsiella variicola]
WMKSCCAFSESRGQTATGSLFRAGQYKGRSMTANNELAYDKEFILLARFCNICSANVKNVSFFCSRSQK